MVSRQQVESGNFADASRALCSFAETVERARFFRRRVFFGISGYDDDPRGLFQIDQVRAFVRSVDVRFPYWLWFLSPRGRTLSLVAFCQCRILAASPKGTVVDQNDLHHFLAAHLASLEELRARLGLSVEEVRATATAALEHFFGPERQE
jgi:hypothetical protein